MLESAWDAALVVGRPSQVLQRQLFPRIPRGWRVGRRPKTDDTLGKVTFRGAGLYLKLGLPGYLSHLQKWGELQ